MTASASSTSSDAHVDLPVPECVTEGDEMAPQYNPNAVEEPLYKWWEASGFFKPSEYKKGEKKSYVLPMPPPNVTGGLHMGHAMFVALQDILARYHRMKGEPTLWLPGTDHAGIATQLLVERSLNAEGINRYDLGRDKFLEKVWEWKGEKGGYITEQLRRLGASADWSRERFTMDDGLSEAVAEAFVQLHDKGLVYRGEYMVNWSPQPPHRRLRPRGRVLRGGGQALLLQVPHCRGAAPTTTCRWPPRAPRPSWATLPCACTLRTRATRS